MLTFVPKFLCQAFRPLRWKGGPGSTWNSITVLVLFLYLTFALVHLPASSDQAGSSAEELAAGKALQQLWAQFREVAG